MRFAAAVPVGRREITRDHITLYRAIIEGVDPAQAWERYCGLEGEFSAQLLEATMAWVRQELIAEALAAGKPDLVALLRRDPRRIKTDADTPSLEEFSARFAHAQDFSEAELLELWKEEFGHGAESQRRRARLVARLREALDLLEKVPRRKPLASDSVHRWLSPALARRLDAAGLATLGEVAASLLARRSRRWEQVEGVGEVWAARLQDWLEAAGIASSSAAAGAPPSCELERQIAPLEALVDQHERRAALPSPTELSADTSADISSDIAPAPRGEDALAERPALPAQASSENLLGAADDVHAVQLWLEARASNENTRRAYRKAAERLLLWCRYERGLGLRELKVSDCAAYRDWLHALGRVSEEEWRQAGWRIEARQWLASGRPGRRHSAEWRPFSGALSPRSIEQELLVVRALFSFLLKAGYVAHHPWELVGRAAAIPQRLSDAREQFVERSMTLDQWKFVLQGVESRAQDVNEPGADLRLRLRAVLYLGFACGLRASEMLGLTLSSLIARNSGWRLRVFGKGAKVRTIPLPSPARDAILDYLASVGLPVAQVIELSAAGSGLPILRAQRGRRAAGRPAPTEPMSYPTLYTGLKRYLDARARALELDDPVSAAKLRAASTHWLRHTCGTLALQSGVPLNAVQRVLGHSDLRTTSGYVTADAEMAQAAMESFACNATGAGESGTAHPVMGASDGTF